MKKVLLCGAVLLQSGIVLAQNALFPELNQKKSTPQVVEEIAVEEVQEVISTPATPSEEEKQKNMSGNFEIRPHHLKMVVPPVKKMQFCSVKLTLKNDSQYKVNGINVMFKYNGVDVPYRFAGVNSGEETTGSLTLAGQSCQGLLEVPTMNVVLCQAVGLNTDDCKSRVKYVLE